MSEIYKTQIGNSKTIDIVTTMHDLIKYCDKCSETSWSLWHYYRDEPFWFINASGAIVVFPAENNKSVSFKFKTKIAGRTEEEDDDIKNVKIRLPFKFLSNFWRNLEMTLINCEINLTLNWSNRCFIIDNPIASQESTFTVTDTKLHVPIVTLWTHDNAKLF